jgi:hypothetical protein
MAFLDGTNIRAHQKAAGAERMGADAEERDRREALGRSRGGYGTKAVVKARSARTTASARSTPSARPRRAWKR